MSVGERLKSLRLNMKRTLQEQSELLNVSLNSVYRWEHDLTIPRKPVLKKIAAYYDVPLEWLIHGSASEEYDGKCDGCILNPDKNTEQKILKMLRKLSESSKYKILGYIERMCVEDESDQ